MDIQPIIDFITKNYQNDKPFLAGIDGRSGSGKSTLAQKLKNQFSNSVILSLDTFNMYELESVNAKAIDAISNIKKPDTILIVEGIFALNNKLESFYDCKIWVECSPQIGYERGLARDISLNGINNSEKWKNYWMPKEEEYIKTEKPQTKVDFIITT